MTKFTKSEIKDARARFHELIGLDDSSIDDRLVADIMDGRWRAAEKFKAELPGLKDRAKAAYDAEVARYLAKNPTGKNSHKAGLRAAREIWGGFQA